MPRLASPSLAGKRPPVAAQAPTRTLSCEPPSSSRATLRGQELISKDSGTQSPLREPPADWDAEAAVMMGTERRFFHLLLHV